jgi:two-component system phosphate regulon sensor histidine kinase PhoR
MIAMAAAGLALLAWQVGAWQGWLLFGLAAGALLWLGWHLERDVYRPITRLTRLMERRREGEWGSTALPMRDDDIGRLLTAFNTLAETQKKELDGLTNRSALLAAILAQTRDGVIVTDQQGTITAINEAALSIFGAIPRDAIGRPFPNFARHHQMIELWQAMRRSGREQDSTIPLESRNLLVQMSAAPLDADTLKGYLVLLYDLTPVRRLEMVRRDFVTNISHELRTPLAALRAVIETLQDGAVEEPEMAQRFLEKANQEVDALTQMVEELLELSRIESGRVPFRFAEVDLVALVAGVVERLLPTAERRGLTLTLHGEEREPVPVLADAPRIEQVVSNLVYNAIKFTPEGGQIDVTVGVTENGQEGMVTVRDTGIGISADQLPRIFERFFKGDRARSSQGTGLGLAIAKHTVQAHNGRIEVRSKERKGSTFWFTLPLKTAATAANNFPENAP